MTEVKRQVEKEATYQSHLERSKTLWNRWSSWYGMSEKDFEPMRTDLVNQLGLANGATVLEVGCGPGVNFSLIREAIGPDGRLVAIDYSPVMVEKASDRIAANGWSNVTVKRADATTADLGEGYDAAIATLSLSVMPDIERAVRNVHSAIKPGGQLGVLDIRPFPARPANVFNPLVQRFLRWYANWNPDGDVPTAVETVFGPYEPLETYFRGTTYTLRATRATE